MHWWLHHSLWLIIHGSPVSGRLQICDGGQRPHGTAGGVGALHDGRSRGVCGLGGGSDGQVRHGHGCWSHTLTRSWGTLPLCHWAVFCWDRKERESQDEGKKKNWQEWRDRYWAILVITSGVTWHRCVSIFQACRHWCWINLYWFFAFNTLRKTNKSALSVCICIHIVTTVAFWWPYTVSALMDSVGFLFFSAIPHRLLRRSFKGNSQVPQLSPVYGESEEYAQGLKKEHSDSWDLMWLSSNLWQEMKGHLYSKSQSSKSGL